MLGVLSVVISGELNKEDIFAALTVKDTLEVIDTRRDYEKINDLFNVRNTFN